MLLILHRPGDAESGPLGHPCDDGAGEHPINIDSRFSLRFFGCEYLCVEACFSHNSCVSMIIMDDDDDDDDNFAMMMSVGRWHVRTPNEVLTRSIFVCVCLHQKPIAGWLCCLLNGEWRRASEWR